MKKSPQDWYVKSLSTILADKNDYVGDFGKDEAYKYVIKGFADKYSNSFLYCNDKDLADSEKVNLFNVYWETFKPGNYSLLLDTLIVSKSSYNFLTKDKDLLNLKKQSSAQKLIKNKLHLEHLTPMSFSRQKLLGLKSYTENDVRDCFKYAVVSLISKDESKLLDRGGKIDDKDIETLQSLQGRFGSLIKAEEISEANEIKNKRLSLKNNGNGLIRLIHLFNNGVVFVDYEGKELSIDDLYLMLIKNKFVLHQYRK